ncbi:MAG: hypothetical protein JNL19_14160 [Burkholderiales bacterium]|nr:hypothetical protein [Burkholderiales bacterium]
MKTKLIAVSAVLLATAATTAAQADGAKHFYRGPVVGPHHVRPAYVAPAPVYRHGHWRPGYWSGGRWIAPVFVAAAIGGLAYAATTPVYAAPATVTYVPPAPVPVAYGYDSPMAVVQTPVAPDAFDYADANRDGVISYQEAVTYPHWQRNFGFIDRNRDGNLTRDEVTGWRTH